MRFTTDGALERLQNPVNKAFIHKAVMQEQRLAFHTEPYLNVEDFPQQAWLEYKEWLKGLLPEDKYNRVLQMHRLPNDTVASTKDIFDELNKFMDAQDKYVKWEFVAPEFEQDFSAYQDEVLKDQVFWRTKGLEFLKSKICSLLVIDVPAMQVTSRPEPYFFFLRIDRVIDVMYSDCGDVEYLVYYDSPNKAVFLDDEYYRVFQRLDRSSEWQIASEVPHSFYSENGQLLDGLGYTPACAFINNSIADTRMVNKIGPVTNVLGKLDYLLFWRAAQRYFNMYGSFPIMSSYQEECTYTDTEGHQCDGGYLKWDLDDSIVDNHGGLANTRTIVHRCPQCESRKLIGPGTHLSFPTPRDATDFNIMEDPVKFTEVSNDKLEWGRSETDNMEQEIYLSCVGYDGEAQNKQAINQDQVSANFESKEAVLNRLKEQFERCIKFTNDTVARLRYGRYFIKSTVDLGSEYFLKTADELTHLLKLSKTAGTPMFYIADLRSQVTRTKFKNNPEMLQRYEILEQLEPYPDLTLSEVNGMGLNVEMDLVYIKANFSSLIDRFEREHTNIIQFGSLTSFQNKISSINKKLLEYAKQRELAPGARENPSRNDRFAS